MGHIQAVCGRRSNQFDQSKVKNIYQVEDEDDNESDFFSIYQFGNTASDKIWLNKIEVDGVQIKMELDTGSSLTIMSIGDYERIFKKPPNLQKSTTILRTYTGEQIIPLGFWDAQVTVNGKTTTLRRWIVRRGGNPIFGRSWLREFRLQWHQLKTLKLSGTNCSKKSVQKLEDLLTQ